MPRSILPPLLALLVWATAADAKIINPVTLEQIVKDQPLIFTAKVTEFLPDKPGLVFTPVDKFRGEFPFDRVPVNLTGDKEAVDEKQPAMLMDRLDRDLPFIVFAGRRGKTYDAVAYTNGTWFRMSGVVEQQDGKDVTRWKFTHCEPYFRRTYKGTTEDLIKAVQAGMKGEKLPPYNEKEEPGYGPPLKKPKDDGKKPLARSGNERDSSLIGPLPLGVIQIPFLGLIAALAALFPALFGGMALLMRRWVAALSVASFVSLLAAVFLYFPKWIAWTGLKSLGGLWLTGAIIAAVGALWAIRRYRRAIREGRAEDYQPRYLDRVGLAVLTLLAAGGLTYAVLTGDSLRESPWLEVVLITVPIVVCLYFVLTHWLRTGGEGSKTVAISAETVGLWAGAFACAVAGVALMSGPRGPAIMAGGGKGGFKLDEQPLWVFEPKKNGEIASTPCVTSD
ncbi:MAG TPA: tripartite tricarboxylate transporter TctB family protein, partial [Gemmataceae bacterium]|nr:tripartite tricarboxylate transporter TctB family protein [Gemmataceae bacterium]